MPYRPGIFETTVMGVKRLTIELDPIETVSCCVYSPGQVVSGAIVVLGSKNINLNGSLT